MSKNSVPENETSLEQQVRLRAAEQGKNPVEGANGTAITSIEQQAIINEES